MISNMIFIYIYRVYILAYKINKKWQGSIPADSVFLLAYLPGRRVPHQGGPQKM